MVLRRVQTARVSFTIETGILVLCKQSPYLIPAKYCLWIKSYGEYDYNPQNKGFQVRYFFSLFSGKYFNDELESSFSSHLFKINLEKSSSQHTSLPSCLESKIRLSTQ